MRPPRIAILALFLVASLFIVGRALAMTARSTASYPARRQSSKSVWGFMYYNTPFSLFPPNAAISLTDDNSTSFAARPAAFGPRLSAHGLSGQLWVGNGFAEDTVNGDGELGCSDLPGWESGNTRAALKNAVAAIGGPRISAATRKTIPAERGDELLDPDNRDAITGPRRRSEVPVDDGTDDYLHRGAGSPLSRYDSSASSTHADIQSMQESAEIEGKIVLLMRGGCGFLEKIMWAQRRGAIAVVVGDNRKGGPLIQMFAHGEEVDNVTIPSVFTARTTAQLLSSLTQPGSYIEDLIDDNGRPILKVQQSTRTTGAKKRKRPDPASAKTAFPRSTLAPVKEKRSIAEKEERSESPAAESPSLFSRAFGLGKSRRSVEGQSRPPRSGRLDWVLVEDWNDEKEKMVSDSLGKSGKDGKNAKSAEDAFVIGVHDWRDPDLVDKSGSKSSSRGRQDDKKTGLKSASQSEDDRKDSSNADANGPKGGSITPGSGEYNPASVQSKDTKDAGFRSGASASPQGSKGHGLISKIFGDHREDDLLEDVVDDYDSDDVTVPDDPDNGAHEGLWVTITPTSSASPFFDTLLVLVISPLVTLTVVYSLLILRARIRRRRWRAPKSVVERLPVRTYHTVAASPTMSPRLPSPSSTSPTTPLLQQSQSRPRPRSRTTSGVLESENFLTPTSTPAVPTPRPRSRVAAREHEKGASGFSAEWRKYMGRQVECVVCLEEYVDGVSRVMSLPCGHEFHVDCITPWLTTRRRTCPICKGDVVRSLARGASSSLRYEPYQDDSEDEPDAEGSRSRSADRGSDVEQGIFSSENRDSGRSNRGESWLGLLSSSFGARPRSRSRSRSPEDRDR